MLDTLILPEEIDYHFYNDVLECVLERQQRRKNGTIPPLRIYCRSNGGDSRSAFAIVAAIQMDGDVQGIMIGETISSAATIWAACQKRYVHPLARMGIHPVSWNGADGIFDSRRLSAIADEFEWTDKQQCQIYSAASNRPLDWWEHFYQKASKLHWFTADELIELGMAQALNGTE